MLDARPMSRPAVALSTVPALESRPAMIAAEAERPAPPLSAAELRTAIEHLLMSRPDPVYLITAEGRVAAESPTGALTRGKAASIDRVLAELAQLAPRRSEFFVRSELGVGFHIAPCLPRGGGRVYLVTVAKLAPIGRGRLTMRQAELISFLQEGYSNAQIAKRMNIAPSTVKTMLERLYRFAAVSNRQALVHWASGARVG